MLHHAGACYDGLEEGAILRGGYLTELVQLPKRTASIVSVPFPRSTGGGGEVKGVCHEKLPQVLLIETFELRRRVEIANVAVQILAGIVLVIILEVVNYVLCPLAAVWNVCIQELLGIGEIVETGLDLDGVPCLRRGRGNARIFNRNDRFSFERGRAVKAERPADARPHCCFRIHCYIYDSPKLFMLFACIFSISSSV